MTTTIPGLKCHHRIVTRSCRIGKTTKGAGEEALSSLADAFYSYAIDEGVEDGDAQPNVNWHFVLIREET